MSGTRPGVSGPSSGAHALRLHLVMIPPGTRGTPHVHAASETAVYVVSGEADVWHGPGLVRRSAVRAGDFIYIPPGTPHLAVNRGEVTSIAVVARVPITPDQPGSVVIELPRHLRRPGKLPGSGAANELSPPPQSLSRGRGEPGTRGGILLRRGTPGASLPLRRIHRE